MNKLISIAEFNDPFDVKYNLLKDKLEQAEIPYLISNFHARSLESIVENQGGLFIEVKVYEHRFAEADEIIKSIH
jgi:hypothetical protein